MAIVQLWRTPAPSSGSFYDGVAFTVLPGRTCLLTFRYEGERGAFEQGALRFVGVVAFKCTYLYGLSAEMIRSAYDTLVDLGDSGWLREVQAVHPNAREGAQLRHLRICFDDGPCYEFVCAAFTPIGPAEAQEAG